MTHTYIPYDKVNQIAYKDLFYINQPEKLSDFYSFSPDLQGLIEATQTRKKNPVNRPLLVDVLKSHYAQTGFTEKQRSNIDNLLNENTFTVVTAHQPCLLTGPAYYFYKIFSTVQLCAILKGAMPDCDFVPVFISGSEDHDFEETNHLQIFGKRIEWQTDQRGPVGRFNTDGLEVSINEFLSLLGNRPAAASISEMINDALRNASKYNEFVFNLLNKLFGKYGLIILNMDDKALKSAFIPIMQKELTERPVNNLCGRLRKHYWNFNINHKRIPEISTCFICRISPENVFILKTTLIASTIQIPGLPKQKL
jgi:bacillithiol synthase